MTDYRYNIASRGLVRRYFHICGIVAGFAVNSRLIGKGING